MRNPNSDSKATLDQAAVGPPPVAVSEAKVPLTGGPVDSPAEAAGRRTLSTAFVRIGPDGHLTVELQNGQVMVLRNVVMRSKDYCGVQVFGRPAGKQFCGGYAEVTAARPGGGPITQ